MWWPLLHLLRVFYDACGHISVQERKPFEEEAASGIDALLVTAPMLETIITVFLQYFESFRSGDIDMSAFFYFLRQPWFN